MRKALLTIVAIGLLVARSLAQIPDSRPID